MTLGRKNYDLSKLKDNQPGISVGSEVERSNPLILKLMDCKKRDYIAAIPLYLSDLGRIQTSNLLSRNQVLYSVKLRGPLGGQIYIFLTLQKTEILNKIVEKPEEAIIFVSV